MRLLSIMIVFVGLAPGMASAQDFVPINPETVANYCYHGGMLYSVGARLYVPGTQGQ